MKSQNCRRMLLNIQDRWNELAEKAVTAQIRNRPEAHYYAAGFGLFYDDYTVIHERGDDALVRGTLGADGRPSRRGVGAARRRA